MRAFTLVIVSVTTAVFANQTYHSRQSLRKHLLQDYDRHVRPALDPTTPTDVTIDMSIHQIRELDERMQILEMNVWMRFHWNDTFLAWDKHKYPGLDTMDFGTDEVWLPDIFCYNSVDEERTGAEVFVNPVVIADFNGQMSWGMPVLLKTSCKISIANYPFDHQICNLKFGSWTKLNNQINVVNRFGSAVLDNYVENVEWTLLEAPSRKNVIKYGRSEYGDITFSVSLVRKPMYYVYYIILPCCFFILIGVLSFYLPPETGEKVTLAITVLLALVVFLLVVMENIPVTSDEFPAIGMFFLCSIGLHSLSTAMCVVIANIHRGGDYCNRAPRWVRTLVLKYLIKVTCMSAQTRKYRKAYKIRKDHTESPSSRSELECQPRKFRKLEEISIKSETENKYSNELNPKTDTEILEEIHECLKKRNEFTLNQVKEEVEMNLVTLEWKMMALVLDRVFFLFFTVMAVVYSATIFVIFT